MDEPGAFGVLIDQLDQLRPRLRMDFPHQPE